MLNNMGAAPEIPPHVENCGAGAFLCLGTSCSAPRPKSKCEKVTHTGPVRLWTGRCDVDSQTKTEV